MEKRSWMESHVTWMPARRVCHITSNQFITAAHDGHAWWTFLAKTGCFLTFCKWKVTIAVTLLGMSLLQARMAGGFSPMTSQLSGRDCARIWAQGNTVRHGDGPRNSRFLSHYMAIMGKCYTFDVQKVDIGWYKQLGQCIEGAICSLTEPQNDCGERHLSSLTLTLRICEPLMSNAHTLILAGPGDCPAWHNCSRVGDLQ